MYSNVMEKICNFLFISCVFFEWGDDVGGTNAVAVKKFNNWKNVWKINQQISIKK